MDRSCKALQCHWNYTFYELSTIFMMEVLPSLLLINRKGTSALDPRDRQPACNDQDLDRVVYRDNT